MFHCTTALPVVSCLMIKGSCSVKKLSGGTMKCVLLVTALYLFATTESWLTPFLNNKLLPSGFFIYHCDRSRGGGVFLQVTFLQTCFLASSLRINYVLWR